MTPESQMNIISKKHSTSTSSTSSVNTALTSAPTPPAPVINSSPPSQTIATTKREITWKENALHISQKLLHDDQHFKPQFQQFLSIVKQEALEKNHYHCPTCFISYAWPFDEYTYEYWTKDFITILANDLNAAGIKIYIDDENSRFGRDSVLYMQNGIRDCDTVLLIGTESLVAKNNIRTSNIATEINLIRTKIKTWDKTRYSEQKSQTTSSMLIDKLQPLIPIIISGTMETALPADFQRRYVTEEWAPNEQSRITTVNYADCLKELLSTLYRPKGNVDSLKKRWKEKSFSILPVKTGNMDETTTRTFLQKQYLSNIFTASSLLPVDQAQALALGYVALHHSEANSSPSIITSNQTLLRSTPVASTENVYPAVSLPVAGRISPKLAPLKEHSPSTPTITSNPIEVINLPTKHGCDLSLVLIVNNNYQEILNDWKRKHHVGDILIIKHSDTWEAHRLLRDEKQNQSTNRISSNFTHDIESLAHISLRKLTLPNSNESVYEVDVPPDGTCLFYSIALSFLLPVVNDSDVFVIRFKQLFGDNLNPTAPEELRKLLITYDGHAQFINQRAVGLEVLVDVYLRMRLVNYMKQRQGIFSNVNYTEAEEKTFEDAMDRMAKPKTWGSHRELTAASQLFKRCIVVYEKDNASRLIERARYGEEYNSTPLYLVHTSTNESSKINNHYHYLIAPQHIPILNRQLPEQRNDIIEQEIEIVKIAIASPLGKLLAQITPANIASFDKSTILDLLNQQTLFRGHTPSNPIEVINLPAKHKPHPATCFAIGNSNFKSMCEQNGLFIDKSLLIKEIIDDKTQVKLIIRPRRTGKTLNLSMIGDYFNIFNKGCQHLFDNLHIWYVNECRYQTEFAKYPVLFISFKDIRATSFEAAYESFQELLSQLYIDHKKILFEGILKDKEDEQRKYQSIIDCQAKPALIKIALQKLTAYLYQHYFQRVIVLIDEYDTPIHSGYTHGYYHPIIDFMRDLLAPLLKDNASLHRAILTGILRIAKESIFSGLNNIKVYSVVSGEFSQYFGFTEVEVRTLLRTVNAESLFEQISEWYGGYQIGSTEIFNPWSIVNLINDFANVANPLQMQFKSYWINTSENKMVEDILHKLNTSTKFMCRSLVENRAVPQKINEHTTFKEFDKDPLNLWSFLLLSGYLTILTRETVTDDQYFSYQLIIPNKEIYDFYIGLIQRWYADVNNLVFQRVKIANPIINIDRLKKAQELIEMTTQSLSKVKKNRAVLLLGNTGSGKSTLIKYLLGDYNPSNVNNDIEGPRIGHGVHSETRYIQAYEDKKSNIVYIDTPGLNDTRGDEVVTDLRISVEVMSKVVNEISLIYVISYDDLFSRGAGIRALAHNIKYMGVLPDFQQPIVVITKIPRASLLESMFNMVRIYLGEALGIYLIPHHILKLKETMKNIAEIVLLDVSDGGQSRERLIDILKMKSVPFHKIFDFSTHNQTVLGDFNKIVYDALHESVMLMTRCLEHRQFIQDGEIELKKLENDLPLTDNKDHRQHPQRLMNELTDKLLHLKTDYQHIKQLVENRLLIFTCLETIVTSMSFPTFPSLVGQFLSQYHLLDAIYLNTTPMMKNSTTNNLPVSDEFDEKATPVSAVPSPTRPSETQLLLNHSSLYQQSDYQQLDRSPDFSVDPQQEENTALENANNLASTPCLII